MPNDPLWRQRGEEAERLRGIVPLVLVSLALWLPLLIVLPAWLIGVLLVTLLAGCTIGALLPPLSAFAAGSSGARITGFGYEGS